jgi:ribosome biogenesis protein SSF1/2
MPKTGNRRKKTRTHVEDTKLTEELENAPKSFIVKRGRIGIHLKELIVNLRELMYPFTAIKLRESNKNSLKDFLGVAGQFGVSHMMLVTQTETANYLRLIKNPKGPTITLKVDEYSLSKDVLKYQQETKRNSKIFSMTL